MWPWWIHTLGSSSCFQKGFMNLPESDKEELNQFMSQSSQKIKEHFHIIVNEGRVLSFQGEAIVVKVVK